MNKKMKLQVAKYIWKDISKILHKATLIILSILAVFGFIYGSIKLAGIIPNNYLYLLIVDGVLATFITVLFSNDLSASKETLLRRIIHPIVTIPMLLGSTMIFHFILYYSFSIFDVANRGVVLLFTLVTMFFFKIWWYLEFDPVEHFFEYLDRVIQKVELNNKEKQEGNNFVVDELNRVFPTNIEPFKQEAQQHKIVTIKQSWDDLKGKYTND